MRRILLLSEQQMIYPSIFSKYYMPKGFYVLSIDVKIFARMGFSTKMFSDYVHIQSFMGTKTIEISYFLKTLFFTLSNTRLWKRRTKFTVFAPGKLSEVHFRTAGFVSGLSEPGGAGIAPKVLTDQLTLSQPGGRICPPSSRFTDLPTLLLRHLLRPTIHV